MADLDLDALEKELHDGWYDRVKRSDTVLALIQRVRKAEKSEALLKIIAANHVDHILEIETREEKLKARLEMIAASHQTELHTQYKIREALAEFEEKDA